MSRHTSGMRGPVVHQARRPGGAVDRCARPALTTENAKEFSCALHRALGVPLARASRTHRHERAANPMITYIRGTAFETALVAAAEQKTTRIAACQ
jgi:hypothetical protein